MIQVQQTKIQLQPVHDPIFQFKLQFTQQIRQASTIFIAFYGPSSLFLQSTLKKQDKIGNINFIKAKQISFADIYYKSQKIFIVFNDQFQPCYEYYFSDLINDNFKYTRIILIDWRHVALVEDQAISLRYLKTSSYNDKILGLCFTQNVFGAAADILANGQINERKVVYFVGIINEYEITKSTLEIFNSILSFGLQIVSDISNSLKKYNMKKYANKLYL